MPKNRKSKKSKRSGRKGPSTQLSLEGKAMEANIEEIVDQDIANISKISPEEKREFLARLSKSLDGGKPGANAEVSERNNSAGSSMFFTPSEQRKLENQNQSKKQETDDEDGDPEDAVDEVNEEEEPSDVTRNTVGTAKQTMPTKQEHNTVQLAIKEEQTNIKDDSTGSSTKPLVALAKVIQQNLEKPKSRSNKAKETP